MYRSVAHNLLKRMSEKTVSAAKKASERVKSKYNILGSFVSTKKSRAQAWISSEGVKYVPYAKYYGAYLFIYGFLLNYALHILFSFPLSYETVPAWGTAYYFLKEELTEIITHTIRRSRGLE